MIEVYCRISKGQGGTISLVYWILLGDLIWITNLYNFSRKRLNKKINVGRYFPHTQFIERYPKEILSSIGAETFKVDYKYFRNHVKSQIPSSKSQYFQLRFDLWKLLLGI